MQGGERHKLVRELLQSSRELLNRLQTGAEFGNAHTLRGVAVHGVQPGFFLVWSTKGSGPGHDRPDASPSQVLDCCLPPVSVHSTPDAYPDNVGSHAEE